MGTPTRRHTGPASRGWRGAVAVLACLIMAVLPLRAAWGGDLHRCATPAVVQHAASPAVHDHSSHGHDVRSPQPAGHDVGSHDGHGERSANASASHHPAPDRPGVGCDSCAVHCAAVLRDVDDAAPAPLPAMTVVAERPRFDPGLNPAPADPPPRS